MSPVRLFFAGGKNMVIEKREWKASPDRSITIRSAVALDAESLCRHRYITSGETYFMARYPEECQYDMDQVRKDLTSIEEHPRNFMVTAFDGDQVIGDLGVRQIFSHMKYLHRAYMGISIQKAYCNLGLGRTLLEIAIAQTAQNGFEQLELGTFSDNLRALHLYEKYGFVRYGIQPRAFKLKDGTDRDEVIMVKMLGTNAENN